MDVPLLGRSISFIDLSISAGFSLVGRFVCMLWGMLDVTPAKICSGHQSNQNYIEVDSHGEIFWFLLCNSFSLYLVGLIERMLARCNFLFNKDGKKKIRSTTAIISTSPTIKRERKRIFEFTKLKTFSADDANAIPSVSSATNQGNNCSSVLHMIWLNIRKALTLN